MDPECYEKDMLKPTNIYIYNEFVLFTVKHNYYIPNNPANKSEKRKYF